MAELLSRLPRIYEKSKAEYENYQSGKGFKSKPFPLDSNIICLGNNADFLYELKKRHAFFDFIYIDPPFYSDADYKAKLEINRKMVKTTVYGDKWNNLDDYLEMLLIRLFFIKDTLKDSGLVAVHLDTHAAHYVKVLMDEIFGPDNFVNELIWSYKSGGARGKSFAKKHDTILLYSKSENYYFNPQKEVSYNRGGKAYRFKGVEEYADEEGKWYTLVNRKDVLSVDMVGRTSSERNGYATQKPEKLIEILLSSCCPKGGLAGDFFAGSGTLAKAAAGLGMQYIICDSSPVAYALSCRRMKEAGSKFRHLKSSEIDVIKKLSDSGLNEEQTAYLCKMMK